MKVVIHNLKRKPFANSFAHGLDLRTLKSTEPLDLSRFFVGLISLGVIGFIAGVVFAWSHNLLARR
jgi:hypothetical protein